MGIESRGSGATAYPNARRTPTVHHSAPSSGRLSPAIDTITEMYTLYTHRDSYGMTAELVLEELGIEYEPIVFNVHDETQWPEEFTEANPNRRVPTLVTDDGPLYESAAILVHLAETHGAGRLMPPPGDPRRQRYWQWHFYLMSTFQPEVLIQFHPEKYFPEDADAQDALRQASLPWIDRIWRVLDDAIGEGPYILGELYTTCDISFAMQALWRENQPPDLPRYPNARRCLRGILERPAARRVLQRNEREHLALL